MSKLETFEILDGALSVASVLGLLVGLVVGCFPFLSSVLLTSNFSSPSLSR